MAVSKAENRASVPSLTQLRQKIQAYQKDCEGIAQEMNATAASFKAHFRKPCPLYLSVQRLSTGSVYLRWRKTGIQSKQPYLLMEEEAGLLLLKTMTPAVRQTYYQYHHQVLYLNSQHAALLAEQRRWQFYGQQRQAFEQLKNHFKENSIATTKESLLL